MYLDNKQKQAYEENGYLVLPNFISAAQCDELIAEADQLIQSFRSEDAPSFFSTTDQVKVSTDYFLNSGDRIHYFFEPEAAQASEKFLEKPQDFLNKIGHALHDINPVFSKFSRQEALHSICQDLGFSEPTLMQSMYIFKNPRIGGEVTCHQDGTFLFTDPMTVTGFWFALEDATVENGCLYGIKGGHRTPLKRKFKRSIDSKVTFEELDSSPWQMENCVPLEAKKGTLIVLHGLFPHMSGFNRSAFPRPAYTLHVTDARAHYPAENWLQRSAEFPARGFSIG